MIFQLLRVKHWVKNLFIFIPLFFAGELFDTDRLLSCVYGFVAFSLIASSIYILNDIRDVEQDKLHPKKKNRPIASGKISTLMAGGLFVVLMFLGFFLGYWLNQYFFYIIATYFLLNVAYSLGLKKISIVDILIVASGFLLRTMAGGFVGDIEVSRWLLIMIFLLSLFLAMAKRRDDVLMFLSSGVSLRKSVKNYNLEFTDSALTMLSAIIVIAYIMYTISPEAEQHLGSADTYGTAIFVIAGILRYLQIALVEKNSGSPVRILYKDPFIQITVITWIASFFFIIYY